MKNNLIKTMFIMLLSFGIVSCGDVSNSDGIDTTAASYRHIIGEVIVNSVDEYSNPANVCLNLGSIHNMDITIKASKKYSIPDPEAKSAFLKNIKIGVQFTEIKTGVKSIFYEVTNIGDFQNAEIKYDTQLSSRFSFMTKDQDPFYQELQKNEVRQYDLTVVVRASEQVPMLQDITHEFAYKFGTVKVAGSIEACGK